MCVQAQISEQTVGTGSLPFHTWVSNSVHPLGGKCIYSVSHLIEFGLFALPVQRCLGKPAAGGQSCLRSRKADTGRAASWCSPGASGANASQRQTQQRPDSGRRRLGCPRSSMQIPLSAVSARIIGRQTETAMLNPRPDYAAASAGL